MWKCCKLNCLKLPFSMIKCTFKYTALWNMEWARYFVNTQINYIFLHGANRTKQSFTWLSSTENLKRFGIEINDDYYTSRSTSSGGRSNFRWARSKYVMKSILNKRFATNLQRKIIDKNCWKFIRIIVNKNRDN